MNSNNGNVLYIPGFKEPLSPKQPGKVIESLTKHAGKSFQRMILPGDASYDNHSEFSLSEIRERTSTLLESIPSETILVTYSLSALPVFGAINDKIELVRERVSKVVFLHPADNPVYSVAAMDWILSRGKQELKPIKEYLEGATEEVFNGLIGDWRGNGSQFQKDLNDISNSQIDLVAMLTSLDIDFSIIGGENDAIIRKSVMEKGQNSLVDLIRGHIPDLSEQRFIY